MAIDVRLEREGRVAVMTIDNPPVNALHPDAAALLAKHIAAIGSEPEIRAVVLTASGKHFVAGADIDFIRTLEPGPAERYVRDVQAMQDSLGRLPQPVIAALNGSALGGGCELAMACDIRIAEEQATFGQPEVRLGIIPGAGGTQNLPRLVPVGRAKRMLFTGERISAAEALAIGLVDEVVPQGTAREHAVALGERIAQNGPMAVAMTKRAVNFGLEKGVAEGQGLEPLLFASLVETDDFREGVAAFFEKRRPVFKRQ